MKNVDHWKPTKIAKGAKDFGPSPDPRYVAVSSRLMVSCVVQGYYPVIRQYASGRLLDLGCGNVPFYELYKDSVQDVICVDWENSLHKNEFLDHFMDLNKPLSLESNSFDTVLLTDVLEHIYKPAELLSEVARVLKPLGHVIIGVPFLYWLHEEPFDFYRYTEHSLRQMCADLGLEVKTLSPYGGAPEVLMDIFGKCLTEAKFHLAVRVYSAFCQTLIKLKQLKAISRRTANSFPLGYILAAQKITAPDSESLSR
jgi:SAM-dependent methyltransferase